MYHQKDEALVIIGAMSAPEHATAEVHTQPDGGVHVVVTIPADKGPVYLTLTVSRHADTGEWQAHLPLWPEGEDLAKDINYQGQLICYTSRKAEDDFDADGDWIEPDRTDPEAVDTWEVTSLGTATLDRLVGTAALSDRPPTYHPAAAFTVASRLPCRCARDALNGYQKGTCFYCYRPVSTVSKDVDIADVDHLFPRRLQQLGIVPNLDQVWNLVLACQSCNRGAMGKFDLTPDLAYVARLERRNEYLIASHHPLRETLMAQTRDDTSGRDGFLQAMYELSVSYQVVAWKAPLAGDPTF